MNAVAEIAIPDAPLPVRYEAARRALEECDSIDDVKDWSDKAAALAVYARQANDSSLHMMALRIKARAERRCGELLKALPRGDSATRFGGDRAGASHPPASGGQASVIRPTRTQAARDAGLSDYQRKNAIRVANVPAESFEQQVESDTPPTVAALAAQGVVKAAQPNPARLMASEARAALTTFARVCERLDARQAAEAMSANETDALRRHVRTVDSWLDRFVTKLPDRE